MATRTGNGIFKGAGRILLYLVLAGLLVAVFKIFHWNPFSVITWIWNSVVGIITGISDWFSGQSWFRKLFTP